jgi:hypothetical protein
MSEQTKEAIKEPAKKPLKFETYKYADISTGYITKRDSEILEECSESDDPLTGLGGYRGPGPVVYNYTEGFFVWVPEGCPREELPEYLDGYRKAGLSEQFCRLVTECVEQGCTFLRLDRDGGEVEGLDTYDW